MVFVVGSIGSDNFIVIYYLIFSLGAFLTIVPLQLLLSVSPSGSSSISTV